MIVDYDPRWPAWFDREAERVREALGERALRLEHVGSTAVPGLAAKPIIDMLLVVTNSAEEDGYLPALLAAGYVLRIREPEWHQHRLFKGPDTAVNLHVFSIGCSEIDRMIAFRDWLRISPSDRDLYEHTKRTLRTKLRAHLNEYASAKTPVINEIMGRITNARHPR